MSNWPVVIDGIRITTNGHQLPVDEFVCGESFDDRRERLSHLVEAAPQLLAACEAVEWVRTWDRDGQAMRRCPWCNVFYYERLSRIDWQHAPDCQLAAAIKAAKGQA